MATERGQSVKSCLPARLQDPVLLAAAASGLAVWLALAGGRTRSDQQTQPA